MFNFQSILTSIALLCSMSAASYQPPIGIPDPEVEWSGGDHPITAVAPARPSNWNAAVTDFYYVNPSANNATNTDNIYGHPGKPRATMPSGVSPGSYIELHGTFSTDKSTVIYKCSLDAPCWIRGQSESNMPTIPGSLSLDDSSYVFVENLNFDGGTGSAMSVIGNSHNVVIRNSRFTNREQPNGNTTAITIIPSDGETVSNIVVYNNHFEDLGDWTVTEDLDFHAVTPSLWGRDSTAELKNVWILDNYCTHLSGDCVQVNAGNWTDSHKYLHHIYIGHNESYQNRQTGFWVKQASDVIISQNKAHGYKGNGSANAGAGIGYQYEKHNLWIIFNKIYDSVYGIRQSDTGNAAVGSDVYILGNVIYDIAPAENNTVYSHSNSWHQGVGIALWHGNLDRYIVDNTIFNTYDGITAIFNGYVEVSGNIISQVQTDDYSFMLSLEHSARNNNTSVDRNLFHNDNGIRFRDWTPGGPEFTSGISDYQASLKPQASGKHQIPSSDGTCQNCKSGSPLFANADSGNFNLQADSPAATGNRKHSAYDTFLGLYGIDIYVDFNGAPRSVNSSIGAFEVSPQNSPPAQMSQPTLQMIN